MGFQILPFQALPRHEICQFVRIIETRLHGGRHV